ncbi:hypothetical protein TRIP_B350087 [uncultured Desulfatiglans sp.]|nr:hypothetical protein TRIP_B350087 [uncultured Desulfatiglans sp.]
MDWWSRFSGSEQKQRPQAQLGQGIPVMVVQQPEIASAEAVRKPAKWRFLALKDWVAVLVVALVFFVVLFVLVLVRDLSGLGAESVLGVKGWFRSADLVSERGLTSFFKLVLTGAAFGAGVYVLSRFRKG